ncbi:GDSL lipase/esterase [Dillenia turbinata]|uniref:GDSL lipase/esterase n=1 Tax=Dillenia turbinata TaxID=194707 RepID=A0AAN8Z6W7_9MAGN
MAVTLIFICLMHFHLTTVQILCNATGSPPKFPAIFVFGDSTVDTGNNNYIKTVAKGNHPPYGKTFPGKVPTGRFSDGKIVPDLLASFLGIKDFVPPFLNPNLPDYELPTGVCFASAGSGYDDLTTVATQAIPMSKQPQYLKEYTERLKVYVGNEKAIKIISGALTFISAGSNDFLVTYYMTGARRIGFGINEYQDFIQLRLRKFVEELYVLGCQKMAVVGVPPIGVLPIQKTMKFVDPMERSSLEEQNLAAQSYNQKLEEFLTQIQQSLPGSTIIYIDAYDMILDMFNHPENYGFTEANRGCCGTGLFEVGPLCTPITPTCNDSSQYMFWDSVHPTESTYRHLTQNFKKQILLKISTLEASSATDPLIKYLQE